MRLALVCAWGVAALLSGSGTAVAKGPMDGCPALIVETFGDRADGACRIAWCESTWDPSATGRAGERGWFQIHPIHGPALSSYDPETNVLAAYQWSRGGRDWSQWSCA